MSQQSDHRDVDSAAEPRAPAAGVPTKQGKLSRRRPDMPGVDGSISLLEHAQDIVTVIVGVILIVLAAVLLVSGIVDFLTLPSRSIYGAASTLLDQVLLVLILVEIVHTVVLSLRAHRLVAQPFIIVGLVAVIRRILFVLSNQVHVSTSELALYIAMIVVFVAALIAVSRFEKREE
jgi:uncharacterized membrane protein (DUF373 family)